MCRRDDKTILIIGDGHDLVHLLNFRLREADLVEGRRVDTLVDVFFTLEGAHGEHAFEGAFDRLCIAGGEQVGEVFNRDTQLLDVRDFTIDPDVTGVGGRGNRRQRRYVPDHRHGAVFRVQGQGNLPVDRHLVDRALARCFKPLLWNAIETCLFNDFRIVRVEENVELRLVQIAVMFDAGGSFDAVGVVKENAEITDATDAGFRTHGRLSGLDAWVAEDALFGFTRLPVVVDLLVRTGGDAHAPATAFILIDEDDAVFLDPHDPKVIEQARIDGIPDLWMDAARNSPVYKMAVEWKVALPLHPEYRTLPMVWYVPPLSPISAAANAGQLGVNGEIPDVKQLRIPVKYLANLLTAGDTQPVERALERMLAMRAFQRAKHVEGRFNKAVLDQVGMTQAEVEEMYQIMAIANYEDRFVIPTTHREYAENTFDVRVGCGFSFGNGCSDGASQTSLFGGTKRRTIPIKAEI